MCFDVFPQRADIEGTPGEENPQAGPDQHGTEATVGTVRAVSCAHEG
ncbi:hypothetical protein GGQ69_000266 [Micrococcus sp. TA1]|nr:hypothetical protein [Micrococcus sp. TA1]